MTAGHAEYLPGVDLERQVVQPLVGHVLDRHVLARRGRVSRGLHHRYRQVDRPLVFDRGRFRRSALAQAGRRPDDEVDQLVLVDVGGGLLADDLAVPQHDDTVGDRTDGGQVVRDEQHRRPFGDDGPDEVEEPVHLLLGKEHGGLVEDEHGVRAAAARAVAAQVFRGPDDRQPRLVDRRQFARVAVEVERDLVALEHGSGAAVLGDPVNRFPAAGGDPLAERQVLQDAQPRRERQVLVHETEPDLARLAGGKGQRDLLAAHEQASARFRVVDSGKHLHQRRLARAVLPEQPDHLALADAQVDVVQRPVTAEILGDAAHLNRGRGPCLGSYRLLAGCGRFPQADVLV